MAAIIKRCFICDYEYDEDQKRPLMLDCGHSFCLSCLQQIKEGGEATCPTCRRCWEEKTIEELPLCYQLLPEEPEGVAKLCTDHKSQVLFYCETCKCRLCRKCLREKHRRCEWVLLEERLDPMKEDFMQKAEVTFARLTESLDKIGTTTSENKAVLDLIRDLKKVLVPAEVQFAAYQQQILLLRVKVSKEVVALENLKTDWAIPPDSDFMSMLQSKTRALEEIQKVLWWPHQPNWGFLGKIVDNFQQNRTRELTLAEICEGAALPLSDDESGFDGQNDDNVEVEEVEEENEAQQQVEDEENEEEEGGSSVRENPAAAAAAMATSNAVQTNNSARSSGFHFTPEDAARIFSAGAPFIAESGALTSANESTASPSFSFGSFSPGEILPARASSQFSFGSASPGTSMLSPQTPMPVTQRNRPQAPVFSTRRATQALATPPSLYNFRRTLRPSANTVPSNTASSFGTTPPTPPTTAPTSSAFSFGTVLPPPPITVPMSSTFSFPTSSALSFGTAPPTQPTNVPASSAFSFGTAPQPPEPIGPKSFDFSFGPALQPPETIAPSSSAFTFGTAQQLPEPTAPTSSAFSFGTNPQQLETTAPSSSAFSFATASRPQESTAPTGSAFSFETAPHPPETSTPSSSGFSFGTAPQLPEPTAPTCSAFSFGTAQQPPETTSVLFPVTSVAPVVHSFRFAAIGQVPTTNAASTSGTHVIPASTQTVATASSTTRRVLAATVYTPGSSAAASSIESFTGTSATIPEISASTDVVPRTTTATSTLSSVAASTAGFSPRELFSLAASGINTVTLVASPMPTVDNAEPVREAVPSRSPSAFVFSPTPVIQSSTPTTQFSVQNSQVISTAVQTSASAIQTTSAITTQNSAITEVFSESTSVSVNPTATLLVTATGALVSTTEGTTPSAQTSPESILPTEPMNVVEQVNDTNDNNSAQGRPVTARNPTVEVHQQSSVVDSEMESVSTVRNADHFDLTDAVADALRQLPEKPPSSSITLAAFQFAEGIRQEMSRTDTGEQRKADLAYQNEVVDASASVVDALEQLKKLQKIHRSPKSGSSVSGEVFSSSGTANTNREASFTGVSAAPMITENASVITNGRSESIGAAAIPTPVIASLPAMNFSQMLPTYLSSAQPISTPSALGFTQSAALITPAVASASSEEAASAPDGTVETTAETPAETAASRGNSDFEVTVVPVAPDELAAQEPERDSATAAAMKAPELEDRVADATFLEGFGDLFEATEDSAAIPATLTPVAEGVAAARGDTSTNDVSMSAASENITALFQTDVEATITATGGSEAAGSTARAGGSQGATPLNSGFTFMTPSAAASVRPKQPTPQATGGGASTSCLFEETFPILSLLLGTVQSTTTEGDNLHQAEPRVVLRRGGPFLKRPSRMRRKPRDKS